MLKGFWRTLMNRILGRPHFPAAAFPFDQLGGVVVDLFYFLQGFFGPADSRHEGVLVGVAGPGRSDAPVG